MSFTITSHQPSFTGERSSKTVSTIYADDDNIVTAKSGRDGILCVKAKPFPHDEETDTILGRRRHSITRSIGKLILGVVIVGSVPAILLASSVMGLAALVYGGQGARKQ